MHIFKTENNISNNKTHHEKALYEQTDGIRVKKQQRNGTSSFKFWRNNYQFKSSQ